MPPAIALVGTMVAGSALLPAPRAAAAGLATIQVVAERTTLRADGRSTTLLTAQVRDDRGAYVPDGTRVHFSTTAGRLDNSAAVTQNGVAQVTLTSADIPASAIVTVTLDGDFQAPPTTVTITFTADAQVSETGTNWIRFEGAYVGYIADYHIVQVNGRRGHSSAQVVYRSLKISADTLQVDVQSSILVAQGHVAVYEGNDKKTYNALRFALLQGQGTAEKLDADGRSTPIQIQTHPGHVDESSLAPGQQPVGFKSWYETWQLKDVSQGNVAVVARSIALNPGSQLQFRRPTFYLNGEKTATLPYHVMALQQNQLFREQVVGLGANGLQVDFPLYYDMRPDGIGTLHIRRGAQVGSSAYSIQPGWHVDAEQDYTGKNGTEGSVEVDNVAQNDWGVSLRHAQRLDPVTHGSLFVDFPNNSNLFVTSQVQRDFHRFTLNATGYGSRSPGVLDGLTGRTPAGGVMRGQLYGEGNPRMLWGIRHLNYALSAGTSVQNFYGFSENARGILTNNNVGMRVFTTPLTVAHSTTLTQSVSTGQAWVGGSAITRKVYTGPGSGMTLLGSTALNHSLGKIGYGGLTYDYAQTPLALGLSATNAVGAQTTGKQRAGLNLYLGNDSKVSLSVNATQGLDVSQSQVYSTMMFGLGGPWRGSITYTTTRYGSAGNGLPGYSFQDAEFRLGRRILGRDVDLYYSTTVKKFQIEMAGVRF